MESLSTYINKLKQTSNVIQNIIYAEVYIISICAQFQLFHRFVLDLSNFTLYVAMTATIIQQLQQNSRDLKKNTILAKKIPNICVETLRSVTQYRDIFQFFRKNVWTKYNVGMWLCLNKATCTKIQIIFKKQLKISTTVCM